MRDNHRRLIYILALLLFSGLFLVSAYRIFSYFSESRAQEAAFEALEERIGTPELPHIRLVTEDTKDIEEEETGRSSVLSEYEALYEENPDFFGWIQIEDTKLSYPVMYSPEDPEHYLYRAFDGSEAFAGVPFLDEDCSEDGGNYLIHGHNMKSGAMFAVLLSYADPEFYEEHPNIRFNTLFERGEYENMAALYDTGITAQYGDQLLTLSTCSYHTDNGRFVVVARKK